MILQFFQCMAMLMASVNAKAHVNLDSYYGHGHGHGPSDDNKFNPHKNICWDVSTYTKVNHRSEPCEKCYPKLEKSRIPRSEQVCQNVTETTCDIVGYTECKPVMVPREYKSQEDEYDYYNPWTCVDYSESVNHTKYKPVCRNVTKENCVTTWEISPTGEKVWSGNKDCKPVTWEECTQEPYPAPFEKDMVNCTQGEGTPYCKCKPVMRQMMTVDYVCEAKSAVKCETTTKPICTEVKWDDIHQVVSDECTTDMVWVPYQDKLHEKRCLLDTNIDGTVPRAPVITSTSTHLPRYTVN
jgi:hypothetical protein